MERCGIAEVIDLRHAPRAPARGAELERARAGEVAQDRVRDSRSALPSVFVRRSVDDRRPVLRPELNWHSADEPSGIAGRSCQSAHAESTRRLRAAAGGGQKADVTREGVKRVRDRRLRRWGLRPFYRVTHMLEAPKPRAPVKKPVSYVRLPVRAPGGPLAQRRRDERRDRLS